MILVIIKLFILESRFQLDCNVALFDNNDSKSPHPPDVS